MPWRYEWLSIYHPLVGIGRIKGRMGVQELAYIRIGRIYVKRSFRTRRKTRR